MPKKLRTTRTSAMLGNTRTAGKGTPIKRDRKVEIRKKIEARRRSVVARKVAMKTAFVKRKAAFDGMKAQKLNAFDRAIISNPKAVINQVEVDAYSVKAKGESLTFSFGSKSSKDFTVLKRVNAQGEVDENGTPIVGGAPDLDEDLRAPAPTTGDIPAPEAVPSMGAVEELTEPMSDAAPEDAAKAIVTVNDKLSEIEKREDVDKILKQELKQVKEALTGVSAIIRKIKPALRAAASRGKKPTTIGREELKTIVDFLGSADKLYTSEMTGFETKASVSDVSGFSTVVAGLRSSTDMSLERAHDVLASYQKKEASVSDVRGIIKEVKASVEKWQLFKKTAGIFQGEAKYAGASKSHLKNILASVQEMVSNEEIGSDSIASQAIEFLNLNEKEFKTVNAALRRQGSSTMPNSVPSVQSISNSDNLESIFDE